MTGDHIGNYSYYGNYHRSLYCKIIYIDKLIYENFNTVFI